MTVRKRKRSKAQRPLMVGVSAATLALTASPAFADLYARKPNPVTAAVQAATRQAQQAQVQTNAVTQAALASFARASAIRQQMDAAQAVARAAAAAATSSVPNGLVVGGLQVDPGVAANPSLWQNANAPTQTTSNGRTEVNVQQTGAQAILNWQTFNVGSKTDVSFDQQKNSSWVVLNRVNDPSASPTQILGTISAPGTVLVMNRNGVIFGGASQVNVGSLVAGAATITDSQFLTNGIYSANSNSTYAPSFTDAQGTVEVKAGAQITTNSPTSALSGGGYVMLLGGTVTNAGSITTPLGQTLLAAGDNFLLRPGLATTSNQWSTTRGSEVAPVLASGSSNGAVSNTGEIYSQQGDITLAGHTVTQGGVLLSTTSVSQRGTIHLLNSSSDSTGSVTLTGNSYTAVLPELDSTTTALDTQRDSLISNSTTENTLRGTGAAAQFDDLSLLSDRQDQSRIEINTGGNVEFQNGSLTQAQGGQIAASAAGRIQVDTGAILDVSGVQNVALNVSTNNIEVNVQGNELRDSAANRDSQTLFNDTVWVNAQDLIYVPAGTGGDPNARYYTAGGLLEVSGYVGNTGHTIGEWTASGGTITLSAKEVVAQTGSIFDLEGGSIAYQGGEMLETLLQGADGKLYTADTAPANVLMVSLGQSFTVSHERWGQQYAQTYSNPLTQSTVAQYQPGYVVGKDGGQLVLSTPTVVFEGTLDAGVINGPSQTHSRPATIADPYKLGQTQVALPGGLVLGQYTSFGEIGAYATDVRFGDGIAEIADTLTVSTAIPTDRVNTAWFDASALSSFGLGGINVATTSSVAVNSPLSLANGGALTLMAPLVDIGANVTARGGSVSLTNFLPSGTGTAGVDDPNGNTHVAIGDNVTLDLRGLWTNALLDATSAPGLGFVNGGSVNVTDSGNVTLGANSLIDVSSGGGVTATGSMVGGRGGNVTLIAGQPDGGSLPSAVLTLGGTIRATGVNGGGTLTLSSPGSVAIGNSTTLSGGNVTFAAGQATPVALTLSAPLTIPAGGVLPMAYSQTSTTIPLDTPTTLTLVPQNTTNNGPSTYIVTHADWTVPAGITVATDVNLFAGPGTVLPAGTTVEWFWGSSGIPVGTVFPSSVFPNGFPVLPYTTVLPRGSIARSDITYAAGTTIPAGTVFQQAVSIQPVSTLDASLFQSGFANYNINAITGVLVSSGTRLAPTMPVYEFTPASLSAPTGSDPSSVLTTWLPPLFQENPVSGTLIQRGGASITLSSVATVGKDIYGGEISVPQGASVSVDPGQTIKLDALGQITVDGDLTAHGGNIDLINVADANGVATWNFDVSGNPHGTSIWVGGDAKLDVSGEAYTALDQFGRAYGTVTNGGTLHVGGTDLSGEANPSSSTTAFLVIRPGAELDADGARITVNTAAGGPRGAAGSPLTEASNGGTISLDTYSGIYNDGNLHARAGGPGAVGGTLWVYLDTANYNSFNNNIAPQPVDLVPSVLQVVQSQPSSALPADIAPGTDPSALVFGHGTVSADAIQAGGFDTVYLGSRDYVMFSGDVSLSVGQSIILNANAISSAPPLSSDPGSAATPVTGSVKLSAPYVKLESPNVINGDGTTTGAIGTPGDINRIPTEASFEVDADLIDFQGALNFASKSFLIPSYTSQYGPGFKNVTFTSQGDIRFLAPAANQPVYTSLLAPENLSLTARQIYAGTNATAYIAAAGKGSTLTIAGIPGANPAVPMSAFGTLALDATTIEQGGVVRAPMGTILLGQNGWHGLAGTLTEEVDFLPGSLTSISSAGLVMPYGGTTDGVTYYYNGAAISPLPVGTQTADLISINAATVSVQKGAVLDLSGGGTLKGAGFISGRGGSVDVLTTPLVNANPTTPFSKSSDQVYAVVPGYSSQYAPANSENGAGDPAIGEQITLPAGVPGLPPGTYTLLPSTYALLPGAFRIELGGASPMLSAGVSSIGNGTYALSGTTSIANTAAKSDVPIRVLITPATAVADNSQYDTQNYSDFVLSSASQFNGLRPLLPIDGGTLSFTLQLPSQTPTAPAGSAITFDGTARFQAATGGYNGQVVLSSYYPLEIYADAPTEGFSGISISAQALDNMQAPRLAIGGALTLGYQSNILTLGGGGDIFVRPDVTLEAGEIFLASTGNIDIGAGASLSTIGQSAAPFDSSDGYVYQANSTLLALSNGDLSFVGSNGGSGTITVGAGANLYAGGTLVFATNGASSIDSSAHFGAKSIALAVSNINIGSSADITAAGAPSGLQFDQELFDFLVSGDPTHGAPALQQLTLAASNSINVFGNASLNASGTSVDLVLNTPAIYGWGAAGEQASIAAGKITWNGSNSTPPAILAGGPGTGQGTLTLEAGEIDLGNYLNALSNNSGGRVTYGFDDVNFVATSRIVSAGEGAVSVYQTPSTTLGAVLGQSGVGGNLTLSTPLLTSVQASTIGYTAGGTLTLSTPQGTTPSQASSTVGGGEIDLTGNSVDIESTILLPSGKLVVNSAGDITLGAGSRIDLSGQPSKILSATVYGFGGSVTLNSIQGGVTQAAGGVIDVSATQANAGSISITAQEGTVSLAGALSGGVKGTTSPSDASGDFTVSANALDFPGLNATLNQGGFFDSRSFDLRSGDLTIGDGVEAHNVTVSVDGGSLTVNGTIDASGAAPGSIRLSAMNGLTVASTGILDAHGTVLQVDSYHQPIDANNRGNIELSATHGMLTLQSGATFDVSAPDGVARGVINLDASRTGETSGDINIDATGPVDIKGASSIAVNAFWAYSPTDPYGTIVQDNGDTAGNPVSSTTGYVGMNQIDARSQAFMTAALANTSLLGRLAGLTTYTNAFHLRPGVEIDSATATGTLTVAGDIDLAGFRYASLNPNNPRTSVYGSGEPGELVIRAGGNLDVVGSLSDGFQPAPATEDDNGWLLQSGAQTSNIETLLPIVLNSGTTFPNTSGLSLRYSIPIGAATIKANSVIPVQVTLSSSYQVPAGTTLTAAVYDSGGNVLYAAGTTFSSATSLPAGSQLGAGSMLPGSVAITAMNWPAGATLGIFTDAVALDAAVTVPFEGIIPTGANVQMDSPTAPTRPTGSSGTQGSLLAVAPMLPQGDLSWSIRAVAGADLNAADTRLVKPTRLLQQLGISGNLTLRDTHASISEAEKYFYYNAGTKYYAYGPSGWGCTHYGNTSCGIAYVSQLGVPDPSVIRTGTGNLDLIAGGSFSEDSLFGVYTAGTQSAPILAPNGTNPYNLPRGEASDGTIVPDPLKSAVAQAVYQAWYPQAGGDVLVSAQGDVTGRIAIADNNTTFVDTDLVSNWLWRQGGGGMTTDPTAWWINFGTFVHSQLYVADTSLAAFQGIGTLGGGNLTVIAGGNAGLTGSGGTASNVGTGLDLAVGSTGRVLPDGSLVQTGGGNLTLRIGGTLNPVYPTQAATIYADSLGSIADLRGNISISAGAIGEIAASNGGGAFNGSLDPRSQPYGVFKNSFMTPGPVLTPGDGTVTIETRGDLVMGGANDAGTESSSSINGIPYTLVNPDGSTTFVAGGGSSTFTLWTPSTSISLYSAGGDVGVVSTMGSSNYNENGLLGLYPGTLIVAAANGDLRLSGSDSLELAPSPTGQLELLAAGTIYGQGLTVSMSGASLSELATPFQPAFAGGPGLNNASLDSAYSGGGYKVGPLNPIDFGPDTPQGNLHASDTQPALVYAGVDIDDLQLGQIVEQTPSLGFNPSPTTWYIAAKPFNVIAGRDIVGLGTTPDVFLNNNPNDITVVRAGRDIIYQSVTLAGPGLLDVQAGRNLYQGYYGSLTSIGPLFDIDPNSPSGGASIVAMAGVGANGPDYADFAKLYFDPANQLASGRPLVAGDGKVVQTYAQELLQWLQERFGYTGSGADALDYFLSLPTEQQGVFVRQVFYQELNQGGLEYNDPTSPLFHSYLRGREAIATLFPTTDAQGNSITYTGGITMFSGYPKGSQTLDDAGIATQYGGSVQLLNPAGQTLIGVEGVTPGASAGLLTEGTGDIDIYSEGSILLGESRILTTFGGNILAWSATGDINAGRGSKTTVLMTPPRRVYNNYGAVTLSPTVPSTGAGIGTLNPIPQVTPGNVNLVAPLGTIDAGEAGIRVSGNLNLAALHLVNAANIQVQGTATGLPAVVEVNTGALTAASSAASAVTQAADNIAQHNQSKPVREVPPILNVRFLGFGDCPSDSADATQCQ